MNVAVIFAGGVGKRMNSKIKPKQFLLLRGKPIIIHTIEVFEYHKEIDAIVIACVTEWIDELKLLLDKYHIKKVLKIVPGGTTGQLSIYEGLKAAKEVTVGMERTIVLIHDGVRPLINGVLISNNIAAVEKYGSSITSVLVTETVMEVTEDGSIQNIPARKNSRLARAPQSFWLSDILTAHEKALKEGIIDYIDSCTMMQHYGYQLHLVDGPIDNIKITTPEDFYIARAIMDAKENAQIYGVEDE